MSAVIDLIRPNGLVLLNESFASTNEREGAEIAKEVVSALLESGVKIFYVTHMYEFARRVQEQRAQNVLFLRAERLADGTRTFKVKEGEPVGRAMERICTREYSWQGRQNVRA
jgi:DNA mismatch repair protein MutS